MKLSSRKLTRGSELTLSMTSMIDVIFLLLIFFMITASFQLTERNLESNIKTQDASSAKARANFEPVIIDVKMDGGAVVYKLGNRVLNSDRELVEVLRQFPNKADGAFVRVSDEAPFAMAAAAIQACRDAGFVTVSYIPG